MIYLICIDDTDMPGTKGTGWLVQEMCELMTAEGMGHASPISRHQLFVHEDVPFTSHNSAMCVEWAPREMMGAGKGPGMDDLIEFMAGYLEERAEQGSDPGLCVVRTDKGVDAERLISFGLSAKKRIRTKQQAYDLARETGIHLSEHGGTGDGVIGAVAGIGLRLSGNDGRYRGWYHLGMPGDVVRVGALRQYPFIERLVTRNGTVLSDDMQVRVGSEKTKTVRLAGRQVVVVTRDGTDSPIPFRTITKEEAKQY